MWRWQGAEEGSGTSAQMVVTRTRWMGGAREGRTSGGSCDKPRAIHHHPPTHRSSATSPPPAAPSKQGTWCRGRCRRQGTASRAAPAQAQNGAGMGERDELG